MADLARVPDDVEKTIWGSPAGKKRLAVMTEDHPLEYGGFEL